MIKKLLALVIIVSTFSVAKAGPQEVRKAKELYIKLFTPNQSEGVVNYQKTEISKLLFAGKKATVIKNDLQNFAKEITQLDIEVIIKRHKISKNELPSYADTMSQRLVGLGLVLDDKIEGVTFKSSKGMIYGALLGAATGFVLLKLGHHGSQNGIRSFFILAAASSTAGGAGAIYDHYKFKSEQEALNGLLTEINSQANLTLQQLKNSQTDQFVNELE
jgi:hypothetical protein